MLDTQKQGLLTLIRAALTGEKQVLPEDFRLEDVYDAILQHNIAVMALEGALKCGLNKNDPTVAKLFRVAFRAIGIVEAQDRTAAALFAAFEDAQIDFMPIKGAVLRGMYPKPEYRSMGDMDVLIKLEQYDRIRKVMLEQGFVEKGETDHELIWDCGDLYLELHKILIPSYNDDFYEYYGDGWKMAKPGKTRRCKMMEEDHFVYVFAHMAKHYRDGGVGIRQMCDLWLMKQTQADMNEEYIRDELNKMDLDVFYKNVLCTLDTWFGEGKPSKITDYITEVIYESGAFGKTKERFLAMGARLTGGKKATRFTRYKKVWGRIFLNKNDMRIKYPVLKKMPILMPAMWVYRGIYIAIKEPYKFHKERVSFQVLEQNQIDLYQESLQLVGLRYK